MIPRENHPTRREAITAMSGSIGCLIGASGISTAETLEGDGLSGDQSDGAPSLFSGTRRHKYVPEGDVFSHTEYFESDELYETYGIPEVTFDEGAVPREVVPSEYRDPDEQFVIEYDDTAVIGQIEEFAAFEQKTETVMSAQGASSSATDSLNLDLESIPKYVYKNAEEGDFSSASGPINIAWHPADGLDAAEIHENMKDWGWGSLWSGKHAPEIGDRYINVPGEVVDYKIQDEDIAKDPEGTLSAEQHHIRAYNLPSDESGNISVVGQCHYDPADHGWIGDHDFDFIKTRTHAEQTWRGEGYHTTTRYIGNEEYPKGDQKYLHSEGKFSVIHHSDLEAVDGTIPQDIDNDGLYEDISGDGRLNFPDVNTFLQHADQPAMQDHTAAYDFTGDGSVDLQDVLALFEMV